MKAEGERRINMAEGRAEGHRRIVPGAVTGDGDAGKCAACPSDVRNLYATAHNAAEAFTAASKDGDWRRAARKIAELRQAVDGFRVVVDHHFGGHDG